MVSTALEGVKNALEQIIRDPRYHDLLSLVKTARNGAVYGTKYFGSTPGKEGAYDSFFGGLVGGYFVFGGRSKRSGKISSVNQQIVIYVFARVVLALARIAVKPGVGFPGVSSEPLNSKINHYAWPVFASLSWAMVMLVFRYHPEELQSSLRNSMTYIYKDCNEFDSLRNLVWHNK